jgi:dihydroflavonol-4-reductase
MKEAFRVLENTTGLRAPSMRIPYFVAWTAAHVDELKSRITRRPPKAPLGGVRMAKFKMFFDPAKAIRELGLPQTPPEDAFQEAVDWFRRHGFVRKS